jgi:predicted flavoprotein YhiN
VQPLISNFQAAAKLRFFRQRLRDGHRLGSRQRELSMKLLLSAKIEILRCPLGRGPRAEVTAGGIDSTGLSTRNDAHTRCAGRFMIGEAVDATGWLGGYNFQWYWSSG